MAGTAAGDDIAGILAFRLKTLQIRGALDAAQRTPQLGEAPGAAAEVTREPAVATLDHVDETRRRPTKWTDAASPVRVGEVRSRGREPGFEDGPKGRIGEERHRRGVQAARRFDASIADALTARQQRLGPERTRVPRAGQPLQRGGARGIERGDGLHGVAEQVFEVCGVQRWPSLGGERDTAPPRLTASLRAPGEALRRRRVRRPAREQLAIRREARRERAPTCENVAPRVTQTDHAAPLSRG